MDRILVDAQIHFGKPCVAGTRITVQNVLELLTEGLSFHEIAEDYYPELEFGDIQACVSYAIADLELTRATDGAVLSTA